MPKPGSGLQPWVDYRHLNAITWRDICPLPLIAVLVDPFKGVYTVDLRAASNSKKKQGLAGMQDRRSMVDSLIQNADDDCFPLIFLSRVHLDVYGYPAHNRLCALGQRTDVMVLVK